MRSTWTRRVFERFGWLGVVVLVAIAGTARAEPAPLPSTLPGGYALEREGAVRWVYPTSAESEVVELKQARQKAWQALGRELGQPLAPELDVRVALNPEQMQALAPKGQRLPGYASGVAFPEQGLILLTFAEPGTFLRPNMRDLLVHELSHVALSRAVDGHPVPRWFSEGVAMHQAGEHSLSRVRTLWEGTLRGDLIPMRELSQRFPSDRDQVDLAYAEAADLVGHMLEGRQGPERFAALIAGLRAGKPFEQVVSTAYHQPIEQLEQQWRTQLLQRFGRWPSILSGLTVMWVAGALLLVIGYVQVRRRQRITLKRWAIEEAPLLAIEVPPAAVPAPPPPVRSVADDVLDAWGDQRRRDSGVPTIVHEGRSYTLH